MNAVGRRVENRAKGFGRLLGPALLLYFSTLLALVASEIVIRLLQPRALPEYREVSGDPLFVRDSLLGWRATSNGFSSVSSQEYRIDLRTNASGHRGLPVDPADQCVIVALGDSFVQGLTVTWEDHFARVAERKIYSETGVPCRVIPAGVEGYSTDQALMYYERDLASLRHDLVVHFFYYNDLVCNLARYATECGVGLPSRAYFTLRGDTLLRVATGSITTVAADGALPKGDSTDWTVGAELAESNEYESPVSTPPGLLLRFRRWLNQRSRLYELARNVFRRQPSTRPFKALPFRSVFFVEPSPQRLKVYGTGPDTVVEHAWELTERILVELSASVRSSGASLSIFHIPMRETVYDEEWRVGLEFRGWKPGEWDNTRVVGALYDVCERQSMVCVFPSDTFRALSGRSRLYLVNDPHWSREGHRLVGDLLADHVILFMDGSEAWAGS